MSNSSRCDRKGGLGVGAKERAWLVTIWADANGFRDGTSGAFLAKRWPHLQARMERDSIQDFKGLPRSPDVSMDCSKIQKVLSFPIPGLSEWLEQNPQEPF